MTRRSYIENDGARVPVNYDEIATEITCDGCHKEIVDLVARVGTVTIHVAGFPDLIGAFDAHTDHVTSAANACFNTLLAPPLP